MSLAVHTGHNIIPLFKDLGSTLKEDESINAKAPKRTSPSRYTRTVRERFIGWQNPRYEDEIDLLGEVRKADLDGSSFSIRLADGKKVEGKFSSDQEKVVIDALQEHDHTHLKVIRRGEYDRQSGSLIKIIRVDSISPVPATGPGFNDEERPIWDVVTEIGANVSDEEWSKVPQDLAVHLDHYLYGTGKE